MAFSSGRARNKLHVRFIYAVFNFNVVFVRANLRPRIPSRRAVLRYINTGQPYALQASLLVRFKSSLLTELQ